MPANSSLLQSIIISSVTCVLAAQISSAQASEEQHESFNLTEVSEGIYVHQGKHVNLDHPDHDDIANIGFIIGDNCIAVIDTGGSVAIGLALKNAIKSLSSLPVCYVINTHIHFDHVLGNLAFTEYDPKFVGHENLPSEIEQNRSFFLSEFAGNLGEHPSESAIIGPDITVADELELDLGNRVITLSAHPPSHTYNDLTIFDHKTGTLWLSDLLFIDRIPVFDASLRGWLMTMETLKTQQANHVIPGHGAITMSWPDAANAQENYLTMLLNETREEISKGTFMEEVIEIVGKTEKTQWLLHEQNHGRNVSRAFLELEWE